MDVGCGGGLLIKELNDQGFKNVIGIDNSPVAIARANRRKISIVLSCAEKTRFKNDSFDIIIASDILEHIDDDARAFHEWIRILKFGGKLILFVPAFKFLWSKHDELNMHFRRYTKRDILKLFNSTTVRILRNSYWNFSFFLPKIMGVAVSKFSKSIRHRDHVFFNTVLNQAALGTIMTENKLISTGFNFPIGCSIFMIIEKRKDKVLKSQF